MMSQSNSVRTDVFRDQAAIQSWNVREIGIAEKSNFFSRWRILRSCTKKIDRPHRRMRSC
jgi:hypothetical protein